MIRRAVSRSSRPASKPAPAPASKPAPAPASKPVPPTVSKPVPRPAARTLPPQPRRLTAVEIDELRKRILTQVKRIEAANEWQNRLADDFDLATSEVNVVRLLLQGMEAPCLIALRRTIAETEEEICLLVSSHDKLRDEVYGLAAEMTDSLSGTVPTLAEALNRLDEASSNLGDLIESLRQQLADLIVEFETIMISNAADSPVEESPSEPRVESSNNSYVGSPAAVDSEILQPASPAYYPVDCPAESSVPAKSPVETPAKSPVEIAISREASAREEPAVEPLAPAPAPASALDPVPLDPVDLDPDLDPLPPDLVDKIPPESPLDSTSVESPGAPGNAAPRSPLYPPMDPDLDPDLDPVALDPCQPDPPDEDLAIDKPLDERSVGSAFDAAPTAAAPAVAPDRSPSDASDRSPDIASSLPFSSTVGQPNGTDRCPSAEIRTQIPQRKFSLFCCLPPPSPSSSSPASSPPAPQVDLRLRPPDPDAPSAQEPPPRPEIRSAGEEYAKRADKQLPEREQRPDGDNTATVAAAQLQEPRIRHDGEEHVLLAPKSFPEPSGSAVPRASQYAPAQLSAAQRQPAHLPASLFGSPVFQPGPRFRSRRRRRLRQACRLSAPARKPPGGNSRRHLRRHTLTPNKKFLYFGRQPARKSSSQPASVSAPPVCPPAHRPPCRVRASPRVYLAPDLDVRLQPPRARPPSRRSNRSRVLSRGQPPRIPASC
jgi:hypothetical protein